MLIQIVSHRSSRMNGLASRSAYTARVGESLRIRCWPVLKTRLSLGTMPSEKMVAWMAGTTISNSRTAIGGATMARPIAASRMRSAREFIRLSAGDRPSGGGWRAGDLLVPLLVAVGVELRAELEAVRLGHVGVLLLDLGRHVLPVQAGVAVDLLDDQILRLGRQPPVQELVQHLFVLAVRRNTQIRGAARERRVDLPQLELGRQKLLGQVAHALVL